MGFKDLEDNVLSKTKLRAFAKNVIEKRTHIIDKVKELVEEGGEAHGEAMWSTWALSKKI